jgi:hypothetical protein
LPIDGAIAAPEEGDKRLPTELAVATDLVSALDDRLELAARSVPAVMGRPANSPKVLRVRDLARAQPESVVDAFLEAARARARSDSARSTMFATVSFLQARELPADALPPRWAGFLCCAYAHLADVLRLARHLKDAEYLLATASCHLPSVAPSDHQVPFTYLRFLSRLRRDQGQGGVGDELFHQALSLAFRAK